MYQDNRAGQLVHRLAIITLASITVALTPPMLTLSLPLILLALLRNSTQHSSCCRLRSMGVKILATVLEDVTALPLFEGSRCSLTASSNMALSRAALASPMPGIEHSRSKDMCDRVFSELSDCARRSLDSSIALLFLVPELISIASNSESLREAAPDTYIFSLGLSSIFQSLILIKQKNFPSKFGKFF